VICFLPLPAFLFCEVRRAGANCLAGTLMSRKVQVNDIPLRYAERFRAKKVIHIAQGGHWPPVEAPEETAEHIGKFLSES
jgi:hypothetical protein